MFGVGERGKGGPKASYFSLHFTLIPMHSPAEVPQKPALVKAPVTS